MDFSKRIGFHIPDLLRDQPNRRRLISPLAKEQLSKEGIQRLPHASFIILSDIEL
jgi:hypothetical protein